MTTIPNFVDDYHLPAGEHSCTMEEIEEVFLVTDVREIRWNDFKMMLKRLCDLRIVPDKILINGSFVTGRKEPGDVDFAALVNPDTMRDAISADDDHDAAGAKLFLNPKNQSELRNLFGAHLLIAHDELALTGWSNLFQKGQNGKLREPDPKKDPDWVTRPHQKGIISVDKVDIINYIYGGDEDE